MDPIPMDEVPRAYGEKSGEGRNRYRVLVSQTVVRQCEVYVMADDPDDAELLIEEEVVELDDAIWKTLTVDHIEAKVLR